MTTQNRQSRETETREAAEHPKPWAPASKLPEPKQEQGYVYRWVRLSMFGENDPSNVSAKLREGWVPVKAVDHPEIDLMNTENPKFKDNIVVGGLILCKAPVEMANQRDDYYRGRNRAQIESVDNNFMRDQNETMPLFSKKKSTVSFGSGT